MRHRAQWRAIISLVASSVAAVSLVAGCGGPEQAKDGPGATAQLSPAPTADTPPSTRVPVQLVWSHTGQFFGETQVWYVARVTNSDSSPASVTLNVLALDAAGVIVGSSQNDLPNVPGNSTFDYFGYLGGGGALNTKLTGRPAKIQVTGKPRLSQGDFPTLQTRQIRLAAGAQDTNTDAPFSYNLSANVTNTTGYELAGGVIQQVVLYDTTGRVVGGDTGSSDNVPESLPISMTYREIWTGMPAVGKAARVVYTVWPSSPVG